MTSLEEVEAEKKKDEPLGIIFDIDGTLIAEGERVRGVIVRPGAIEFIRWCKQRGHAVALWTKGHDYWGTHVLMKICKAVMGPQHHEECHRDCRETFSFCWGGDKLRRQQVESPYKKSLDSSLWKWSDSSSSSCGCKWCEAYSFECHQCECHFNYTCPCSTVKDLRKVWRDQTEETQHFVKERTLIVENTPQNCIYNYGNAIYVPTFRGSLVSINIFAPFQRFIQAELETSENVRTIQKCSHGKTYHACFEQSWITKYASEEVSNEQETSHLPPKRLNR